MIHIHTDELLAAVGSLRAAAGGVTDAAGFLLKITSHNDWTCKERFAINEKAMNLRNDITRLQQDAEQYLAAATAAANDFVAEENGVKALFPGVEAMIAKLLSLTDTGNSSSGVAHGGGGHSFGDGSADGVNPEDTSFNHYLRKKQLENLYRMTDQAALRRLLYPEQDRPWLQVVGPGGVLDGVRPVGSFRPDVFALYHGLIPGLVDRAAPNVNAVAISPMVSFSDLQL